MWHSSDSLDASVNNLAVHTHPAMGMVVTPYPKEWARCHIHAHRDGARGGACGVRGKHGAGEAVGAGSGGAPARGTGLPGECWTGGPSRSRRTMYSAYSPTRPVCAIGAYFTHGYDDDTGGSRSTGPARRQS